MQPACVCVCVCVCDMYRILGPVKLSDGPLTEKYCYEMIIEHKSCRVSALSAPACLNTCKQVNDCEMLLACMS